MLHSRPRFAFSFDVAWLLRHERYWRWPGIVLLSLLSVLVSLHQSANPLGFWRGWLVSFGMWALYWNGNSSIFAYFNRRYRHQPLSSRRTSWVFSLYLLNILAITLVVLALKRSLHFPGISASGATFMLVLVEGLVPMILLVGFYEGLYFFSAWRQATLRAVNLEKETALSRLEALKQQVDPHFLFNSLNTMAALVDDNEPAQELLGALASVYRYVLMSRSIASVPLEQELNFVNDYLLLLRARLGADLEVVHDIEDSWRAWHVPPTAVQQVLEYVVKQQVIGPGQPLRIVLHAEAECLSIYNSELQRPAPASPAALQRVVDQFQLLTAAPVTVEVQGTKVAVRLPLLPIPEQR